MQCQTPTDNLVHKNVVEFEISIEFYAKNGIKIDTPRDD